MTTQELEYLVKVNDRDLNELRGRVRDVNKTLGSDVEQSSSRGARGLGRLGKAAGLAALGFAGAGVASLAGAAKIGWDEFQQGQLVASQTEAVIKSTGGAARVTAKDVSTLAGSLMKKSGMDDEAIASGENLLLTFTNIRNEAGRGNDIFNQTTRTMLDMSVALGQDTKSSALQLGKALNDPIKGVTALQRVGVSFTEGQREQIKTMVEAGDTMGAQKLILGELNKEFGGSAEAAGKTLPGQLNILKETFNNLAGEAVGALIPSLTGVLTGLLKHGPAIEETVGSITQRLMPVLRAWWSVMKEDVIPIIDSLREIFANSVRRIAAVLEEHKPELTEIWKNVRALLDAVAVVLKEVVVPILRFALEEVLPKAIGVALPVLAKLSGAFEVIGGVVKTAAQLIGDVLDALGAIGRYVGGAWGKVRDALTAPINGALGVYRTFIGVLERILDLLESIFGKAEAALGALGKVKGKIGGALGHLPGFAEGVTGFRGGLAIVGEGGPELVRLPAGADVIPNRRAAGALAELARSSATPASARGLFDGATFIVRDELDAAAVAGAVSLRLAGMPA